MKRQDVVSITQEILNASETVCDKQKLQLVNTQRAFEWNLQNILSKIIYGTLSRREIVQFLEISTF